MVSRVHGEAGVHELRRRQATAIVLLGVIGAEFNGLGQDDLTRQTSYALSQLLLHAATPALPLYSPLRRAGIDLLGRGFAVYQPYVDLNKVLVALLELCANSDRLVPQLPSAAPLSAQADTCRTAHRALCMIATARTSAVVTALAMEVARYNASTATLQHVTSSPLLKARSEVVRLIELLADKQSTELTDLIIPVSVPSTLHNHFSYATLSCTCSMCR